jgi:hypothetical protein
MKSLRGTFFILAVLISATPLWADNKPASSAAKISEQSRMQIIRGLNAELVFARRPFPIGQKGLTVKDGKVSPNEEEVQRLIAGYGPAVKPGDRARITGIRFKGDNAIVFEINGGPLKKKKWYEHIEISGMGGAATPTDPTADNDRANIRGTFVVLAFDKYVPELSIEQVKDMLKPVLDFNATSAAQAYMDTLPPKVKEAIKNHEVLVGMNREMVTYAMGRPPKKYRDRDGEAEYEEWIYGEPPKEVQFVRFVGDQVVRLEIMKVGGEKIVREQKEVELKPAPVQAAAQDQAVPSGPKPANAPTLRRPGEAAPAAEPLPKGGVNDPDSKSTPIPGNGPPL